MSAATKHSICRRPAMNIVRYAVTGASNGVLLIAALFAGLPAPVQAGALDFSKATVVVREGDFPAAEKIAPNVLTEEMTRRTGLTWNVTDRWPAKADAVIALSVK